MRNVCYNKGMKMLHLQNTAVRKHYTVNKNSSGCGSAKLLYAGELKKTANWKEEMHSHPFYEIVFVKSGTGVLHTETADFPVCEGDLLLYDPNFLHAESTSGKEKLSLYFCGVDDLHLKDDPHTALWTGDSPVLKTGKLKKDIEKTFAFLIREVQKKTYYYDEISRSLLKIILDLILRILAQNNGGNFKTNRSYLCARKYIDENYQNIESVEEICKSVYLSRYYLTHLFKEYSGISPIQYIIFKRMEKAKQLLCETDLSVREIARRTGYAETNSFLKTFKKTESMTPSEYRKKTEKT